MPTYIGLIRYTQQGVSKVKDSPSRVEAFKKAAAAKDGKVKAVYWTLGQYDGVIIVEMPGDAEAATLMLEMGKQGNVSTETLRAFTGEEFGKIAGNVG